MTDPVELFEAGAAPAPRAIAYRMLGTPDDADDVVQDAWLRFGAADRSTPIDNPAAWLTTDRPPGLSIDRLRSAQRRRETYVGPWLADPIGRRARRGEHIGESCGTGRRAAVLAESLSLGFLAVLERVSPLERAVFILHDVFGYPLADVADIIERSPAATRQLAKRARDHVRDRPPPLRPRARPTWSPSPSG